MWKDNTGINDTLVNTSKKLIFILLWYIMAQKKYLYKMSVQI